MRERNENILWIILIFLILGLTMKVYFDSKELSCSQCTLNLKNAYPGDKRNFYELEPVQVQKLFEEWKGGHCIITWEKDQGFILAQDLTEP